MIKIHSDGNEVCFSFKQKNTQDVILVFETAFEEILTSSSKNVGADGGVGRSKSTKQRIHFHFAESINFRCSDLFSFKLREEQPKIFYIQNAQKIDNCLILEIQ